MIRLRRWRTVLLAGLMGLPALAFAKDPIVVIENGVRTAFSRQGLIDFAKDFEGNPRDLTLEILGRAFVFDTPGACGAACTSLRFANSDLGIDRTFTGANTAEVSAAFQDFLKSEEFLKPFIRLMNTSAGAQISGSPTGAVGQTVQFTFSQTFQETVKTMEQKKNPAAPGRDPQISAGFGQFKNDGFTGSVIALSPGGTLDFGAHKDQHLKISVPMQRVSLEGLETYRAGLITQYLVPFYFPGGYTLTVGPGLSYLTTFSLDLPNFSGLMGGALSATFQKDWQRTFATLGTYGGRFENVGGIDTDILANVYGWGAQTGYRWRDRTVFAVFVVGMHERVIGDPVITYHTIGASATYKVLNRFDLTFSLSTLSGLPKQSLINYGLGSAWFF